MTTLKCHTNTLTSLDISQNTSLTSLYCYNNTLPSLDVNQNTNLTVLDCHNNALTSLNVSQNTSLISLFCYINTLTSLDVSLNSSLKNLSCYSNALTSLDVNQNSNLRELFCNSNQLTSLNVSQNTSLKWLYCYANQLTSLNVNNGNNINFSTFYAGDNPNLYCIEVDDSTYSATNWLNIDSTARFSVDCSLFSTINTTKKDISLSAYPNPTTKKITINLGKTYYDINIEVHNTVGQLIFSNDYTAIQYLDLELEGATGIYFVKIQTEVGEAAIRIVKE